MPHTKIGVPVALNYELTLSDIFAITLFVLIIFFYKISDKNYYVYIGAFLIFIYSELLSIANVKSFSFFVSDLIPYMFSLVVIFTTFKYFSLPNKLESLSRIFYILFITILCTTIPVYYQVFTSIKPIAFYDLDEWRYTFLCQNPNQFGVFILLYFFLITLIAIKYFPLRLKYVLVLCYFFIPVALYSGSKAVTLIFFLNLILVNIVSFLKVNFKWRIVIAPMILFVLVINYQQWIESIQSTTGQVDRALSIFEALNKKGTSGVKVGGDSGKTMDEAKELFKEYPITGVGLANKPMYSQSKYEIHNTYLKILAEAGIIGFIGFLCILFMPLFSLIGSRSDLIIKLTGLILFILFAAMNWPHMLFRQRWVWFFMVMFYIIFRIDKNGNIEHSKLSFLNFKNRLSVKL